MRISVFPPSVTVHHPHDKWVARLNSEYFRFGPFGYGDTAEQAVQDFRTKFAKELEIAPADLVDKDGSFAEYDFLKKK